MAVLQPCAPNTGRIRQWQKNTRLSPFLWICWIPTSMYPEALFNPPFTDFHHEGIVGVFPKRATRILNILSELNGNTFVH